MFALRHKVDYHTDCLISGYIRELHDSLSKDDESILNNVPRLVIVCIMSFHHVVEKFEIIGIHTIQLDDGKTIQKTKGVYQSHIVYI